MSIELIIGVVLIAIITGLTVALIVVSRNKIMVETQEKEKLLKEIDLHKDLLQTLNNKIDLLEEKKSDLNETIYNLDLEVAKKQERCNNLN